MVIDTLRRRLTDARAFLFYNPASMQVHQRSYRNYYLVRNTEPYILVMMESFEDMEVFSALIGKDKEAVFLKFLPWSHESVEAVKHVRYFYRKHQAMYPKHQVHILCNTEEEQRLLSGITPHTHFINQNALLDENLFPTAALDPRPYDVVYNGRLVSIKRQHLLSALNGRIGLFGDTSIPTEWDYFNELKRVIPLAKMLHYPHQPYLKDITLHEQIPFAPYEVLAARMNQGYVGAVLSRAEGANYVSAEYLLCGLPVVSTYSIGGRDVFFDDRYCRIVPPNPQKIKQAVEELKALKIAPAFIREETLKKMEPHRQRFREILLEVHRKHQVPIDEKNYWGSIFINRMLEFGSKFPESFHEAMRTK